jgi:Erv1 / Alr family
MDNLDSIIRNQMINSFEENISVKIQLNNSFANYYSQNIKYHIMWLFFHSFSFAYPDTPSEEYKIETANFISNIIPKNITSCGSCQNDYKKYLENINVYRVISSKDELSTFFVELHNHITSKKFEINNRFFLNKFNLTINNSNSIDKPTQYTIDIVKNKYENTDYITLLEEKFNINIFKLIDNKSLSSFFDLFNKINFENLVDKFNIAINIS